MLTEFEKQTPPMTNVIWAEKTNLTRLVRSKILSAETVLDVGTGVRPQTLVWPRLHICVDAHGEYVDRLRQYIGASSRFLIVHSQWRSFLTTLSPKSIDTVVALDFIEHLTKEEGLAFLEEAQRIARKQVIITTPLGYFPQSYDNPGARDHWGMSGGQWQTHRSGWVPTDFSSEWQIVGCREYYSLDQHGQPFEQPHGCIWAIRTCTNGRVTARSVKRHTDVTRTEVRMWGVTMLNRHSPLWLHRLLTRVWLRYTKSLPPIQTSSPDEFGNSERARNCHLRSGDN